MTTTLYASGSAVLSLSVLVAIASLGATIPSHTIGRCLYGAIIIGAVLMTGGSVLEGKHNERT